jgi:hypothetical protein
MLVFPTNVFFLFEDPVFCLLAISTLVCDNSSVFVVFHDLDSCKEYWFIWCFYWLDGGCGYLGRRSQRSCACLIEYYYILTELGCIWYVFLTMGMVTLITWLRSCQASSLYSLCSTLCSLQVSPLAGGIIAVVECVCVCVALVRPWVQSPGLPFTPPSPPPTIKEKK